MSKHTKEPWSIVGFGCGNECDDWRADNDTAATYETMPIMAGGKTIALVVIAGWDSKKLDANAHRIVACVNACEGISTDFLEGWARGDSSLPTWSDRIARVNFIQNKLDELSAQLNKVQALFNSGDWSVLRGDGLMALPYNEAEKVAEELQDFLVNIEKP